MYKFAESIERFVVVEGTSDVELEVCEIWGSSFHGIGSDTAFEKASLATHQMAKPTVERYGSLVLAQKWRDDLPNHQSAAFGFQHRFRITQK